MTAPDAPREAEVRRHLLMCFGAEDFLSNASDTQEEHATHSRRADIYRAALAMLGVRQPARFAVDCSTCGGRHPAHFSQCASDWGDLVCENCHGIILTYDILPEVP